MSNFKIFLMHVNFQSVNFNADVKLVEFAKKRMEKISQFYDQIVDVYVYTKVENSSDRINKFAELKIGIPGDDVVVKKTAKSFEEAINNAADSAERVLKRRKEKQRLLG
jgi:putative sigma-54 modulation protein